MRSRIILLLCVLPSLLLFQCKSCKKTTTIEQVVVHKDLDPKSLASVEIKKAWLTDSILNVELSYTGCKDDYVNLYWDGNYQKSMPMKVNLVVVRMPGAKVCPDKIERSEKWDISPVIPPAGQSVIIKINGYNSPIELKN